MKGGRYQQANLTSRAEEPAIKELLGLPAHIAVCVVMPIGRPVKQLTRLRRKPVSEFAVRERWGGALRDARRR